MTCEVCLEERKDKESFILRTFDVEKEKIESKLKGLSYRLKIYLHGVDIVFTKEEDYREAKKRLKGLYYADGSASLEEVVGNLLREKKYTLGVAESCTGGLLSARIVNVPGSSHYFIGGFIVYSNELKKKFLGVKEETLKKYGAVSEETCEEMLKGIRKKLKTDCGIAITGIAGPGGTETKPEGLTYIGVYVKDAEIIEERIFKAGRNKNRFLSTQTALKLLKDLLER